MTKLLPTIVYVPVLNEFPVLHNYNRKLVEYLDLSAHRHDDTYIPADVFKKTNGNLLSVAGLQQQQLYTFTKEQLCKFISDTLRDFDDKYNYTPGMKLLSERKEYIQSLF